MIKNESTIKPLYAQGGGGGVTGNTMYLGSGYTGHRLGYELIVKQMHHGLFRLRDLRAMYYGNCMQHAQGNRV